MFVVELAIDGTCNVFEFELKKGFCKRFPWNSQLSEFEFTLTMFLSLSLRFQCL